MRALRQTLGGLWELARLAVISRFRLRGAYWRWRAETAFGSDPSAIPFRERWRQMIAYGRWVRRMRRHASGDE